ncbi:hypothetical protein [Aquella oligotrophica]|uniref:Glutamine amidotransferase n=1 Tax=Aquella oligotrophica TaxID=2067065 RepID=A0A2I7N3N9_9NEIS|nr:hypothetical protein [Aquella oligotrophica]AUR51069.1 hypothetical protein CUN60_01690 [Aquella oligotrophica]
MTKTAHVIRHITYEDLGTFEPVLLDYGYKIKYFDAGYDDFLQLSDNPADLLVLMGGLLVFMKMLIFLLFGMSFQF